MKYFLGFLITLCIACNNQKQEVKEEAVDEKWQSLFNGKDMSQWRVYKEDGIRGWEVEDGIMIATGKEEADIITKEQFENFELQLEWNVAPKSNSGIFFHVQEGPDYEAVYITGPEYQLLDDSGHPEEIDVHMSSANYDVQAPSKSVAKGPGEWNQTKLIVDGNHVEHWLNGVKTVEYELQSDDWKQRVANSKWKDNEAYAKYPSGHIGLQDHGGVIKFRNIKIRKL